MSRRDRYGHHAHRRYLLSFPDMVLALAVAGVLGSGMKNAIIAMAVIGWTKFARLARSQVLSIKEDVFVQSARLSGNSSLPCSSSTSCPTSPRPWWSRPRWISAAIDEPGRPVLPGPGRPPPTIEWGYMMSEGRSLLQVSVAGHVPRRRHLHRRGGFTSLATRCATCSTRDRAAEYRRVPFPICQRCIHASPAAGGQSD